MSRLMAYWSKVKVGTSIQWRKRHMHFFFLQIRNNKPKCNKDWKKLRYWVYILRPYPKHDDSDTYDAYLGSTTLYNSFIISIHYKIHILELILTNTYSVDTYHIFGLNQYSDPIPIQHKEGYLHKDLVQSHRRSYFKHAEGYIEYHIIGLWL